MASIGAVKARDARIPLWLFTRTNAFFILEHSFLQQETTYKERDPDEEECCALLNDLVGSAVNEALELVPSSLRTVRRFPVDWSSK